MSELIATHHFDSGINLEVRQGDITEEKVDAIVNAANACLSHGGGVAAAISIKGGLIIQHESNEWVHLHGKVQHDQPAYTRAGNLPCKFVIHAVGPVWGEGDEDRKLKDAITGSLVLAEKLNLTSIAFPAISTGIFGFPVERAAGIFRDAIFSFLNHHQGSLSLIRIILWSSEPAEIFKEALSSTLKSSKTE